MINPNLQELVGPHARLLLKEALAAMQGGNYASVIILAAAVLDVTMHEPSGEVAMADEFDKRSGRLGKDAVWLKNRRNGLVHYEGGQSGLMGEKDASEVLKADALRALKIVESELKRLSKDL